MNIIGIDVGGTNTDAAFIQHGRVVGMAKVPTNHEELIESTEQALNEIMAYCPDSQPAQLHLSTTLSTNAIIEGNGAPAAVLAMPGPGVNLTGLDLGFPFFPVGGYIDHRGREVAALNEDEVLAAARWARSAGAEALAIAGKFSHRNPVHEQQAWAIVDASGLGFSNLTLGHRLSGRANFPRRMVTAYLNSRVAGLQTHFCHMIENLLGTGRYRALQEVLILKADGGTMFLSESCLRPVETILSGPAASIMGAQALSKHTKKNAVIIDIGGTTTDIAVIVAGEPLYQRRGADIAGYRTLVPALLTRSIGLGGDSEIHVEVREGDVHFRLGPKRAGPPAAMGGGRPTPTDAAVALGMANVGVRGRATESLKKMAEPLGLSWQRAAQGIIDAFTHQLVEAVEAIYQRLAGIPLYTVSEILAPPDFYPRVMIGLGGPAQVFIPLAAESMGLPWEILPFSEGANAIGAAAARPTAAITFHADTELEVLTIPEIGCLGRIDGALLFDQARARREALRQAAGHAKKLGLPDHEDVYIVEEESFNVVRGFHTVGRIYNIRAQLRPRVRRIEVTKDIADRKA
ncbi:MAG: hydantoinase/oxoprolinase family protein [Limnochordia bacterium]|nr:hydantoinase/oxoprolinase family protein [Bacillota bacterium]